MKKALIVHGGWDGHEPTLVAQRFKELLSKEGFSAEVSDTLDSFLDVDKLKDLHLIVPVWTMGKISNEQVKSVLEAVACGVGIAGCHGGMCDAFRENVEWQFMTGGQWVAHPGNDGVEFTVNIKGTSSSPIIENLKDFSVKTEQYYLHVDPVIDVLATTRFPIANSYHVSNGQVEMPVVWTKKWGHGRVFYNALGHHADIFDHPTVLEIMRRGFLWAAQGKDIAVENGLKSNIFCI